MIIIFSGLCVISQLYACRQPGEAVSQDYQDGILGDHRAVDQVLTDLHCPLSPEP